jgi:hypothetical protein
MRNFSIIISVTGLIGLITLFSYSGFNLSRIIPILNIYSIFIYVFLVGILYNLANYSTNKLIKSSSLISIFISFLIMMFIPTSYIKLEDKLKIEILLIVFGYMLMITNIFIKRKN